MTKKKRTSRKPRRKFDPEMPDVCPVTGDAHLVDLDSVQPVPGEWMVDIRCQDCGHGGSIPLAPEDINW